MLWSVLGSVGKLDVNGVAGKSHWLSLLFPSAFCSGIERVNAAMMFTVPLYLSHGSSVWHLPEVLVRI